MKKRLNSVFFGVCFLASLLAEAYCFIVLKGEVVNSIGFGLVTLITGYMLLAEIRSVIQSKQEKISYYIDRVMLEELGDYKAKLNDLTSIEKATYIATKKSNENMVKELKELTNRLELLENNNSSALYLIAELQRRSLEGQKKALNMQIHYSKENTHSLLAALNNVEKKIDVDGKITKILNLLEQNENLLKEQSNKINHRHSMEEQEFLEEVAITNQYLEEESVHKNITPPYEDSNKALTADEIATLFESYGQ